MGSTSLNSLSSGVGVWSLTIYSDISSGHLWKDVQKSAEGSNTCNLFYLNAGNVYGGALTDTLVATWYKENWAFFSSFLCITNELFTGCTVVPMHKLCPLFSRAQPIASGLLAPLSCPRQGKQQSLGIPFKSERLQRYESMPRKKIVSHF